VAFFSGRFAHCSWVLCLGACLLSQAPAVAQPSDAEPRSRGYSIFLRGTPIGRESVTVRSGEEGTSIASTGRLSAPLNLTLRQVEFTYDPNWTPRSFFLDASIDGGGLVIRTRFEGGLATSEGARGNTPILAAHQVAPRAVIHFNSVAASYVALARRLTAAEAGAEFRIYVVPQAEITASVGAVHVEQMQLGTSFIDVRRYEMAFENPGARLLVNVTIDSDGDLIRVNIPSQSLDIVREDVASSTSRTRIYSNPGDEAVIIPAAGFNLGATLTRPVGPQERNGSPLPVVILLAGSGVEDRDGFAYGIPTLGQLAGAIAESGAMAVRYDKRGYGQSGGRAESATIDDYAEDVRAVVRWLRDRDDVDDKRIAVVGHSEGAWVALLAASRERRIGAVVSIAGPSVSGADLVLEQQQRALDQTNLSAAEREDRVALQKQIQSSVLTGRGWDEVPTELRAQADTPWFQSLLAFEPARVVRRVRQPLLFLHGALDRQVPVAHAERLAAMARENSRSKSIDLVVVRGVNHLLVPAVTGAVDEYGTLPDRTVSADVTTATAEWLKTTFASIR
jgi:pimeloyl-ACP methyl ester carboxylesterase